MRALAVVLVVAYHAGLPVAGGFIGVDVFFVISGFVITGLLGREFRATGRVNLRSFYLRRFRRLTPPLVAMVSIAVVVSSLVQSPLGQQEVTAATGLGAVFLAANVVIERATGGYFEPAADLNPLLHTWSLSVEEQFYVFFPILLLAAWIIARRRGWRLVPVALVAGLSLLSLAGAVAVASGLQFPVPSFFTSFYSPVLRIWEFGIGALLALVPSRIALGRPVSAGLGAGGVVLILGSAFFVTSSMPFPGLVTLAPVLGTALLITAGAGQPNPVSVFLSRRIPSFIGDFSYSWYLWHWPMIVFAVALLPNMPMAAPIAALLSILPALASYFVIENPLRQYALLPRRRVLRLAALTLIPVLAICAGAYISSKNGWWSAKVAAVQATHVGWDDCLSFATMANGPRENPTYGECSWNTDGAGAPIYLVGDSNAAQFAEALLTAGVDSDRPVYIRTAGGCAFIDIVRQAGPTFDGPDENCLSYVEDTRSWLANAKPGTVVMASTEAYWVDSDLRIGPSVAQVNLAEPDRQRALTAAVTQTVRQVEEAGHSVVLVRPLPHPSFAGDLEASPASCSMLQVLASSCNISTPRALIEAAQADTLKSLQRAAQSSNAKVLDLTNQFCGPKICELDSDGTLLYQDDLHLTVQASRDLAPAFSQALQ